MKKKRERKAYKITSESCDEKRDVCLFFIQENRNTKEEKTKKEKEEKTESGEWTNKAVSLRHKSPLKRADGHAAEQKKMWLVKII